MMCVSAFVIFSFSASIRKFRSAVFVAASVSLILSFYFYAEEPSNNYFLAALAVYISSCLFHQASLLTLKSPEDEKQPVSKLAITIAVYVIIAVLLILFAPNFFERELLWLAISLGYICLASFVTRISSEQFAKASLVKVLMWFSVVALLAATYGHLKYDFDTTFINTALATYLIYLAMISALAVSRDKTDEQIQVSQAQSERQQEDISVQHDPATNLPSYHQVIKQIEAEVKHGGDKKLAVIVFKPINFQQVNSVLGHHNSDILLLQFAYSLQKKVLDKKELLNFNELSQPIRIGRLQGLNFIAVLDLSHSRHPEKSIIEACCLELMAAVPEAMSFKSFSLNFELAFGIALLPEHGNSISEVIAHAGDALLLAEKQQEHLVYFNHDSVLFTEQQLRKMEQLKMDIADEKLGWYLQPQIALSDKKIKGFELLVHWYYQGDVPLELHEFITTAEYSGDVYLLSKQMIKQAFKTLFTLQKLSVYQPVSVNLSSKELLEPDLIDYIERQIQNYNIPAKYLIIELNERVMVNAGQSTKAIIDQLRSLEVGISIDRFTGSYESLRYLRKMSINQVKIDCSYLEAAETNHAEKAIINALVNVARNMQLPFIGTGIKTKEIENNFRNIGGEFGQGSSVTKGVVLAELEIWLEAWFKRNPNSRN